MKQPGLPNAIYLISSADDDIYLTNDNVGAGSKGHFYLSMVILSLNLREEGASQ